MKKYSVFYGSGEARDRSTSESCDYMLVNVENADGEEIELYAEVDPHDYGLNDDNAEEWDERSTFDDLKQMIIEQAKENGIDPDCLSFSEPY